MSELVLSLSDVSLSIEGRQVLHGVDWQVRKGQNWAVVGPNGAGKTSLLRMLNGYLWPSSGKVRLLGESFGRVDLRELRKKIGFVSPFVTDWIQDDQKVLKVVQSGKFASIGLWGAPTDADERLATRLLRRTGCERYAGTSFGKLSQGERQRVVIARALMAKPRILALDEPCSGLDIPARERFLSVLSDLTLRRSPTMIFVTHRIEEIPRGFTHAMLMNNGRVLKEGEIADVLDGAGLTKCFGVKIKVNKWGGRYYAVIEG